MKLLSVLQFLEVNLTSFPPKCFFQKNEIEKFKRVFLTLCLCFEKYQYSSKQQRSSQ